MSATLAPLLVMAMVTVVERMLLLLSCQNKQQRRLRSLQRSWESWRTEGSLQNQDEVCCIWHVYWVPIDRVCDASSPRVHFNEAGYVFSHRAPLPPPPPNFLRMGKVPNLSQNTKAP